MNSYLTRDFLACFRQLPQDVKKKTRKNYRLWQQNPNHPSLRFKRVHTREPIYAVRIGIEWRALGLREGKAIHSDFQTRYYFHSVPVCTEPLF